MKKVIVQKYESVTGGVFDTLEECIEADMRYRLGVFVDQHFRGFGLAEHSTVVETLLENSNELLRIFDPETYEEDSQ